MTHEASYCQVVVAHREPILSAGIADIVRLIEGVRVGLAHAAAPPADAALVITDSCSAAHMPPRTAVLVVDDWPTERALRTLFDAGIKNYLLKCSNAQQLQIAVRHMLEGGNYLSPSLFSRVMQMHSQARPTQRESEVLALLAKGYCNKKIAQVLGIRHDTVKAHVKSLLAKMGASSRTQALALAVQRGMIDIEPEAVTALAGAA